MKILLLGDTQLGSGRTIGRTLQEQDALLEQVTDIADQEQVDLIAFLGDAFESRSTDRDEDEVFVRFLVRASAISRVLLVAGNHDWRGFEKASTIGLFRELGVDVALTPRVYHFDDVCVGCLPWVSPASLIASRNGGGDRGKIHAEVSDLLVRTASDLFRDKTDPGLPAILLGHWAVTGGSLPTGLPVESLGEPVLPLTALIAQGWDAMAFGHIHAQQILSDDPPAFVVGSPYVCDWSEAGHPHGVLLLEAA